MSTNQGIGYPLHRLVWDNRHVMLQQELTTRPVSWIIEIHILYANRSLSKAASIDHIQTIYIQRYYFYFDWLILKNSQIPMLLNLRYENNGFVNRWHVSYFKCTKTCLLRNIFKNIVTWRLIFFSRIWLHSFSHTIVASPFALCVTFH